MKHFGITRPDIEDYMLGLLPPREGVLADMEAHAAAAALDHALRRTWRARWQCGGATRSC